ncbi:uncharacterized protein L201_005163 [Kwoniella dendrophila CBS 6074]|uniref:Ig-like domain-containing protein n=1 Tax=Kwoniella dendrophila CBS 6074 TaxID=1295534 RepID=A0AAX4K0C9_9TREE
MSSRTTFIISAILASLVGPAQAQNTVTSGNGAQTYQCPSDPSVIPAFSNGICQSITFTSTSGTTWLNTQEVVSVTYSNAPNSYYSSGAGDITLTCLWQDPASPSNTIRCLCRGGAATGDQFAQPISIYTGTAYTETCPTIQSDKPQPSPGLNYKKKRQTQKTPEGSGQIACPTVGNEYYLGAVSYTSRTDGNIAPVYQCQYRSLTDPTESTKICNYNNYGYSNTNDVGLCPDHLCENVQPITRRRKRNSFFDLPQPSDQRQTTREEILARQKKR